MQLEALKLGQLFNQSGNGSVNLPRFNSTTKFLISIFLISECLDYVSFTILDRVSMIERANFLRKLKKKKDLNLVYPESFFFLTLLFRGGKKFSYTLYNVEEIRKPSSKASVRSTALIPLPLSLSQAWVKFPV